MERRPAAAEKASPVAGGSIGPSETNVTEIRGVSHAYLTLYVQMAFGWHVKVSNVPQSVLFTAKGIKMVVNGNFG